MVIANALWVDTYNWSGTPKTPIELDQRIPSPGDNWGYWTTVGPFDQYAGDDEHDYDSKTRGYAYSSATLARANVDVLDDCLNVDSTVAEGGSFAQSDPTVNDGYPYLTWETGSVSPTPSPAPSPVPGEVGVFVDGINGSDSNDGLSVNTPVRTFSVAEGILSNTPNLDTIYVLDTISPTMTDTWSLSAGQRLKRSVNCLNDLISVPSGMTLTLTNIVIDGNSLNVMSRGSLVYAIANSTLTLGSGALLENNATQVEGGAIKLDGGGILNISPGATIEDNIASIGGAVFAYSGATISMSGGNVTNNYASTLQTAAPLARGGAFALFSSTLSVTGGTIGGNTAVTSAGVGVAQGGGIYATGTNYHVTLNGGSITNNLARLGSGPTTGDGGGVYLTSTGTLIAHSGSITNNTATGKGGGVYIEDGGSFSVFSATITGNTAAANGDGVYDSTGATLTVSPVSGMPFEFTDTIYLPDRSVIAIGATIANITGSLAFECEDPDSEPTVASGSSYTLQSGDAAKAAYADAGYDISLDPSNNALKVTFAY
jgi:hypothetical protein